MSGLIPAFAFTFLLGSLVGAASEERDNAEAAVGTIFIVTLILFSLWVGARFLS
jgi:hypothetical protein